MLKLNRISKSFKTKQVLNQVSLEIKEKSIVGLLGPNGAGKTTLMRILVGFYTANLGNIVWNRKEIDPKQSEYKKMIGYLPENNPLYPNLTAGEYLELCASFKGIAKSTYRQKVLDAAQQCGLSQVLGQKIETLSKGFKQRVGLAAAILGDPKLLVLDEPTSGLDPNQIIEIRQLIKRLAKNKMILLSTHILPEAKEICDKIVIISQGTIVLDEENKKIKDLEKKFVEMTA